MTFHFQWHLPLTLPSPRAGASKVGATRGERDEGGMKGEGTCAFNATFGLTGRATSHPACRVPDAKVGQNFDMLRPNFILPACSRM